MPDILTSTVRESSEPRPYIVSLNKDVDDEAFEKLISSYNEMDNDDTLFIYLRGPGGNVDVAEAIIHLINQNCDRTVLIAHGEFCSAAFDIFFRSVCTRRILPGAMGMAHYARVTTWITQNNIALNEAEKSQRRWSQKDFQRRLKFYSAIGFTPKEIKMLRANKDVWLDDDRLNELLHNHIKLINAGFN